MHCVLDFLGFTARTKSQKVIIANHVIILWNSLVCSKLTAKRLANSEMHARRLSSEWAWLRKWGSILPSADKSKSIKKMTGNVTRTTKIKKFNGNPDIASNGNYNMTLKGKLKGRSEYTRFKENIKELRQEYLKGNSKDTSHIKLTKWGEHLLWHSGRNTFEK